MTPPARIPSVRVRIPTSRTLWGSPSTHHTPIRGVCTYGFAWPRRSSQCYAIRHTCGGFGHNTEVHTTVLAALGRVRTGLACPFRRGVTLTLALILGLAFASRWRKKPERNKNAKTNRGYSFKKPSGGCTPGNAEDPRAFLRIRSSTTTPILGLVRPFPIRL